MIFVFMFVLGLATFTVFFVGVWVGYNHEKSQKKIKEMRDEGFIRGFNDGVLSELKYQDGEKLEATDFIIMTLKEHEKDLSNLVYRIEELIERNDP